MVNVVVEYLTLFGVYVGWWLIPLSIIFFIRRKLKLFPVECIIYEKRGENIVFNRDVAGRFEEPVTCYRLKNSKDTIPIPQYDWILQYVARPTNLFEKIANLLAGKIGTITLFKYGSKQYKPVEIRVGDKVKRMFKEVKDKQGNPIWITVYKPINVKREMGLLDFEVIDWDDINHMTQELRAIATRRGPLKTFLEKWGPAAAFAIIALVFIIAMYFAVQMLTAAGDRYINAGRDVGGFQPSAPQEPEEIRTSPLDDFLP